MSGGQDTDRASSDACASSPRDRHRHVTAAQTIHGTGATRIRQPPPYPPPPPSLDATLASSTAKFSSSSTVRIASCAAHDIEMLSTLAQAQAECEIGHVCMHLFSCRNRSGESVGERRRRICKQGTHAALLKEFLPLMQLVGAMMVVLVLKIGRERLGVK